MTREVKIKWQKIYYPSGTLNIKDLLKWIVRLINYYPVGKE
ncbi:hypothetical protein [Clostridium bowmanii]|nr:hypothetical protein [Clostridium bowmanii]